MWNSTESTPETFVGGLKVVTYALIEESTGTILHLEHDSDTILHWWDETTSEWEKENKYQIVTKDYSAIDSSLIQPIQVIEQSIESLPGT